MSNIVFFVVIYLRVSTEEQAQSGLGLEAQLDACTAYCRRQGWEVRGVFRDEGVSASLPLEKRRGLVDAIAALAPGSVLLVAKRDRIFRSDPFESAVIERTVISSKARIVSAAGEGTSDDEPGSMLMRELLDAFARYELRVIRARTRAALKAKRKRGERAGQIPFGLRIGSDGRLLEVDQAEEQALAQMSAMRTQGLSLRAIANRLTSLSIPTKNGRPQWEASTVRVLLGRMSNGKAEANDTDQ